MISLAGLSALPAAFNAGVQDNLALGNQQRQRLALEAYGRTIPLLAQGGMPMPGADMQPSPVGQPQQQPPPQISALLQALQARAAQQGGDPSSAMATGGSTPGGGPAPPGSPTAFGKAFEAPPQPPSPQQGEGSPAQRQPLNLPNTQGIRPGSLTWDQVVNAVSRANPGIPPDVLATTVDQFTPLLDQASKERWQQMQDKRYRDVAGMKATAASAKPLLRVQVNDLTSAGEGFTNSQRLVETWKPEYQTGQIDMGFGIGKKGVPGAGDVLNKAARYGIGSEAAGEAANWWQDYQAFKNTIRHALFGSALTATEKAEWEKAIVNPSMDPSLVAKNLERQHAAAQRAASKLANVYVAQGKNPQEIEAALGMSLEELGVAPPQGGGGGNPETIEGDQGEAAEGDMVEGPDGQQYIVQGGQLVNRRTGEPWQQ